MFCRKIGHADGFLGLPVIAGDDTLLELIFWFGGMFEECENGIFAHVGTVGVIEL